ncbi:MAG TPA: 2-amino-4-hydroxy-6-hydroxymethyldihydropteridine diphosphokinase [Gammaproteobacteria bacterium]|nr:2-amino-4-hydroxy-6-hydroxymethyldihydropteridine diphosphokinase [Gammaproteobacteria bacterium]
MPEVFIGAGSNSDPERRLRGALAELTRRFGPVRSSSVYRGAAFGVPAADYSNLAVAFSTELSVDALRDELRAIEALAGRSRADPAVCELDLDLLLYGRRVDAVQRLPRPGLLTLPFVLVPLAELAPELAHPVTGERFAYQPTLRPPSTAMI